MRKHWRGVVVCVALMGVLSGCPSSNPPPPDDPNPPIDKIPTRDHTFPNKEDAVAAMDAGASEDHSAFMASPAADELKRDGDFGSLVELLPDEADGIAGELNHNKDDLWVLTHSHSRSKVVFYFDPNESGDKRLTVLKTDEAQ